MSNMKMKNEEENIGINGGWRSYRRKSAAYRKQRKLNG